MNRKGPSRKSQSYLILSKFGYHFRLSVPQDLRAIVGKTEFRYSLHTWSLAEAKSEARRMAGGRLHLTQERIDRVHAGFRRWGHWSLTVGYFVPGVRHVIAIVAGVASLELGTFAFLAYLGVFFWAGLFICAGYYLGEGWNAFPEMMRRIAVALFGLVPVASAVFWFIRSQRAKRLG